MSLHKEAFTFLTTHHYISHSGYVLAGDLGHTIIESFRNEADQFVS